MTLGSLFSGIGGFELAATWAGIKPIWSNEIDSFCCKVLRKNFDHEIIEKDIREIGKHNLKSVDIITGGFPCQPFSQAGKRKGTKDDRYLWDEMLRIIKELKPSYVIGENVAGLLSMENGGTLEGILTDLEDEGYRAETFTIPACSVGAWHRRNRIWIIAYTKSIRKPAKFGQFQRENEKVSEWDNNAKSNDTDKFPIAYDLSVGRKTWSRKDMESKKQNAKRKKSEYICKVFSNADNQRLQRRNSKELQECTEQGVVRKGNPQNASNPKKTMCKQSGNTWTGRTGLTDRNWWSTEPNVGRVANGIPGRMDRLKGLGNAIVPQVAYELFKAIKELK